MELRLTLYHIVVAVPLLILSPLIIMIAPLLILPVLAYGLWYLFGPVTCSSSGPFSIEAGDFPSSCAAPRRHPKSRSELVQSPGDGVTHTIPQLLSRSIERYGSRPCLASRKTIKVEEKKVIQKVDGKEVEKIHKIPYQTDYQWKTYGQVGDEIVRLGAGFAATGLRFGDKVSLFAGTRPEWQITAQACFAHGFPVVTMYPSLGPDALFFGLDQTRSTHLVTQASLIDNVLKIVDRLPALTHIIYFDEVSAEKLERARKASLAERVKLVSYTELLQLGEKKAAPKQDPKPEDLAVVMYTSGSTGNPKGVMMSHRNILASTAGITSSVEDPILSSDVYIAYLPLAHVLELVAECCMLAYGASIGYSSPLTLRDDAVYSEQGKPAGDLTVLRPTLMASVPLILDRLKSAIFDRVAKSSPVSRLIFKAAYHLKQRNLIAGRSSPILDKFVFSKIARGFGGRLRYLLSGGAPLSADTQRFINVCFCCPVLQGYGLTETLGSGTLCTPLDTTVGNVGPPVASTEIQLVDVPEMGYTSKDVDALNRPTPRGEIVIRGYAVALGYWDMPDKTASDFKEEKDGTRSFATGDIGRWNTNGTLSIIDRKKDLVKLSHGEYIALGNLESVYGHSEYVDNICVFADSHHQRPIGLVVPNHAALASLAAEVGSSNPKDTAASSKDKKVIAALVKRLDKVADSKRLEKWERLANVCLFSEAWTPDSGLLTEAMKLKRHEITKRFEKEIKEAYAGVE